MTAWLSKSPKTTFVTLRWFVLPCYAATRARTLQACHYLDPCYLIQIQEKERQDDKITLGWSPPGSHHYTERELMAETHKENMDNRIKLRHKRVKVTNGAAEATIKCYIDQLWLSHCCYTVCGRSQTPCMTCKQKCFSFVQFSFCSGSIQRAFLLHLLFCSSSIRS